jgi:type I restriction enzyme M protein
MSEELLQRGYLDKPERIGDWLFYNIGSTTLHSLSNHGIIPKIDYGKLNLKKPDALITDTKKVIAVIEYKKPSELQTEKQKTKAIDQELKVAKKLGSRLYIVTDTKDTLWINTLNGEFIRNENDVVLTDNFDRENPKTAKLIQKILSSIDKDSSRIKPLELINPTPLAKQIWQDIWSVSGATPENCLYTFVELFIFKYLSDLNILRGTASFSELMKKYEIDSEEEVLENYASIIRPKIKELFPQSTIDKTTIINGTIFVSKDQKAVKGYSAVFKRILKRFQDYGKLENIDHDFKSQLFESFLKESISKKNWGQYFTPLRVVKSIVKMADIKDGDKICDPACGVGKFLLHPVVDDLEHFFEIKNGEIKPKVTLVGYDKGFDHDEQKTIILAKANMLIYFSDLLRENPTMTERFSELFNKTFVLKTNSILGTLSESAKEEYDLILTNPPYVTSGSSNLKEEIKKSGLEYYYKINASGAEGLFVEWIINALKRGGKAFVVIPDGVMLRNNLKKLRKFIADECNIDCIISLPTKTFFTTPKRTYILGITKKIEPGRSQKDPVFSYLVSEIGESRDVYRFEIPEDNLTDAVNLFNQFKGAKQYFTSDDPRFKKISIDQFISDTDNWMIEKFWSEEEKVALGIEDERLVIGIKDFIEEFEELKNFLDTTVIELNDLYEDVDGKVVFKEIEILDKNYFELTRGKRITKGTINLHKGDIPVYSSSKDGDSVLGKIDENFLIKEKLVIATTPAVLFNLDGSVGKCFIKTDSKYSFIDVVASIRPMKKDIDLDYLRFKLEEAIIKTGATYQTKLYFNKMKSFNMKVKIPCNQDGTFNLDLQKKIAAKQQDVVNLKKEFTEKTLRISDLNVIA